MKSALTGLFVLILVAAAADARAAYGQEQGQGQATPTFIVPRQLAFNFELENSPDLTGANSWWEISIELRVADQKDLAKYLAQLKDGGAGVPPPGTVIKRDSFRRNDLSKEASRRIDFTVPVDEGLRKRFQSVKATPQVVWLKGSVRVHAGKVGDDIINVDVRPSWDLRHFINKDGDVKFKLTPDKQLNWSNGLGRPVVRKPSQ